MVQSTVDVTTVTGKTGYGAHLRIPYTKGKEEKTIKAKLQKNIKIHVTMATCEHLSDLRWLGVERVRPSEFSAATRACRN